MWDEMGEPTRDDLPLRTGPLGWVTQLVDLGYRRGGMTFLRKALVVQLGLGATVGLVGAALTLLYADLTATDLLIIAALSELLYLVDGLLALRPIRRTFRRLDGLGDGKDTAGERWRELADLPFAVLRQRAPWIVMPTLLVLWDMVGVTLLDLPLERFLLFLPGSLLVWSYWLAMRFFVMEQLVRPALCDVGKGLREGGGVERPRITLAKRLFIAVPAIVVMAGTVVAGVVGDHNVATVALGVGVSALVVAAIAGWLVALLADSIAGPLDVLRRAAERVGAGDLDVRVPVVSVDETGSLARAFNEMVHGLRERERLRDAFGTFVDPTLAERVARDGTDLAGEEVELSVMFLDIRGFTTYSEQAEARDVVALLNDLYGEIVPVILRHGGHANKFIGDGLLAVFGAPERHDDHADRAVAAAIEIAALVERRYNGRLRVGVGVNSGPVIVGTIGGGGRLDFTVIGDTVNTAARVESATRKTDDDVLITEATRSLLVSDFGGFYDRPPIPLKGKSQEVELCAPIVAAAKVEAQPAAG